MPIQYRCPECNAMLSVGTRMAGHTLPCPACGASHTVPSKEDPLRSAEPEPVASELDSTTGGPAAEQPAQPYSQDQSPPPLNAPPRRQPEPGDEEDEEFAIRSFDRESDEMDLTPMVDCVFLLLIFFMITASFTVQKTIEVPAPDPDKKGATQSIQLLDDLERTSVVVQINERNEIIVDDVPLADPGGIVDALRDRMSQEQKNELIIEAHAEAFHETVVLVVDAANEVQFQKVRLATSPGSDLD